jgi:hypothetical protein
MWGKTFFRWDGVDQKIFPKDQQVHMVEEVEKEHSKHKEEWAQSREGHKFKEHW